MTTQIKVIHTWSAQDLEYQVNTMLNIGWKLFGELIVKVTSPPPGGTVSYIGDQLQFIQALTYEQG